MIWFTEILFTIDVTGISMLSIEGFGNTNTLLTWGTGHTDTLLVSFLIEVSFPRYCTGNRIEE
jgi:hypothetical protein